MNKASDFLVDDIMKIYADAYDDKKSFEQHIEEIQERLRGMPGNQTWSPAQWEMLNRSNPEFQRQMKKMRKVKWR